MGEQGVMEHSEHDPTTGLPDADRGPGPDENAAGPQGEVSREEDTSGGPLSSGAGPGRGQGGPDVDVPGGASEGVEDEAAGGGGAAGAGGLGGAADDLDRGADVGAEDMPAAEEDVGSEGG
jgi:hypothetical protein